MKLKVVGRADAELKSCLMRTSARYWPFSYVPRRNVNIRFGCRSTSIVILVHVAREALTSRRYAQEHLLHLILPILTLLDSSNTMLT